MDVRLYYQKIREIEDIIDGAVAVVVSHETPEGGKAGVQTDVPKRTAARMIVEGIAHLATAEEVKLFRAAQSEAKRVVDQAAQASKVQFAVVPSAELERLKSAAANAPNPANSGKK